jgi:pyruvate/2-oxoglutarate dehydrogenase complex dihydrolipoamide acyltransferase (E2) component
MLLRVSRRLSLAVRVPSMGDSISEGQVVEICKAVGDKVAVDEVVAVLETDKVSVDITSPAAGSVATIQVSTGDLVKIDATIMTLNDSTSTSIPQPPKEYPVHVTQHKPYVPSIRFRYAKQSNQVPVHPVSKIFQPGKYSEENQVPDKYKTRPFSERELEAINSGGASLLDL